MEELKYIIEDNILAELLGVQNFSNKEAAVLELVKNAYDAGASFLNIKITNSIIVFEDDGCGMSKNNIKNNWMHIGKSDKKYEIEEKKGKKTYSSRFKRDRKICVSEIRS